MGPQNLVRIIFYYVLVLILLAFVGGISIYTDWLWFTEIGFQKIFATIWSTRLLAGLIAGLAVFGIVYLNLFICERLTKEKNAHKRLRPEPRVIGEDRIESPFDIDAFIKKPEPRVIGEDRIESPFDIDAFIKKFTVPVLLVIAIMTGFFAAGQWQTILESMIRFSQKMSAITFFRCHSFNCFYP